MIYFKYTILPVSSVRRQLYSLGNNIRKETVLLKRDFYSKKDDSEEDVETANPILSKESKSLSLKPQGDDAPRQNPIIILPTTRKPVFPYFISTILLRHEKTIDALVNHVNESAKLSIPAYLGVFLRNSQAETVEDDKGIITRVPEVIESTNDIYEVGTFSHIINLQKQGDSSALLFVMGHRRITLKEITSYGSPIMGSVTHWKKQVVSPENSTPKIKAYSNEVISVARELISLNPLAREHLNQHIDRYEFSDPYKLADFATALTSADAAELQRVLTSSDPEERLSIALELLSKEKETAKLQNFIKQQVEEKVNKQQRDYLLREQLKSIKNELGIEKDDKDDLLEKYNARLKVFQELEFSNKVAIMKLLDSELKKIETLEKNSPEYNVTRTYLDWLVSIPHGHYTEDFLNLKKAKIILDEDHFGLDEIKKRILEFIAVGKLQGSITGKIICFIGPPGVGKTSIAKSIARALNRQFYRFSVGGLTDVSEVKGHRRTYIGAMPGKPVQCLKSTNTMNPLILIDEIDKLGKGYSGDPASALLELLDPNQNASFVDHYIDTPLDFSKVLFVCTANDESTIPGPLRDRMEIIRLSGYDIPEKVAIASNYLVRKSIRESGLEKIPNFNLSFTNEALELLVKNYCRESGVRSLEKYIDKICQKVAYKSVGFMEDNLNEDMSALSPESMNITPENLEDFAGKAKYTQDTIYDSDKYETLPIGVVMGLAWNPLGGSPVFVETAAIPIQFNESGGSVNVITGQLGNVMRESVNIAYTFARKFIADKDPENKFFKSNTLHVHVPEGAVEKDGPSAGVTMATSLISLALNKPLRPRLAMTGELSLTGKVLPVGGIKEKTLAARRSGATTVILPEANKRDFEELPEYVKNCVEIYFASNYDDVYKIAFPSLQLSHSNPIN